MTEFNNSDKNFKQGLLAVMSGIISSAIYLLFISEYCINVYEAGLPDRPNYFSKLARFPRALPAVVFIIINIIIFIVLRKRYKRYAYTYILLTTIICLLSFIFVNTDVIRGI